MPRSAGSGAHHAGAPTPAGRVRRNSEPAAQSEPGPTLSRTGGGRPRREPLPLRDSEIGPQRGAAADIGPARSNRNLRASSPSSPQ